MSIIYNYINMFRHDENELIPNSNCRNVGEIISKPQFLKGLELIISSLKSYNTNYFLEIIEKIQQNREINIKEFKYLKDVISNEDFIQIAKKVLNRSGFNTEQNESIDIISVEKISGYLIEYCIIDLIRNQTIDVLNENSIGKLLYTNKWSSIYKIQTGGYILKTETKTEAETEIYSSIDLKYINNTGLIIASIKGKGSVLLDKELKQVSEEGVFYKYINLDIFKDTGFIVASSGFKGEVLLDKHFNQVSTKSCNVFKYDVFEKTGFIIVNIPYKGNILLNKELHNVSNECTFYDNFKLPFFTNIGFIITQSNNGGFKLLDKEGKQISQNGEIYTTINEEYFYYTGLIFVTTASSKYNLLDKYGNIIHSMDEEILFNPVAKQFYTSKLKWFKKYIPNQK